MIENPFNNQGWRGGFIEQKQDADYVFHELNRSICPECKRTIDAQVLLRDNKVHMRKRCPKHGWFEGLVSSDAEMYVNGAKFNKPGTIPLEFSTEVRDGCLSDCGRCSGPPRYLDGSEMSRSSLQNLLR